MADTSLEQYIDVNKYKWEYEFLKWRGQGDPFPYFWRVKYDAFYVEVYLDRENNLPYVIHKSKKLYFPEGLSTQQVQAAYRALMVEDDPNSPHKYFTDSFKVEVGDILFDVGAAEAWVTLENIEHIQHAYILETEPKWIKALQATFAPYQNKVTIINKFASNFDNENNTKLDSICTVQLIGQNILVKVDVEGAERLVVEGMQKLLKHNKVKLVLCTYHRDTDFEFFTTYFKNMGCQTQATEGYMFYPAPEWSMDQQYGKPSIRRGLLRIWQAAQYPYITTSDSNLYLEEPIYKRIVMLQSDLDNNNIDIYNQQLEQLQRQLDSTEQRLKKAIRRKRRYKLCAMTTGILLLLLLIKTIM